MERFMSMDNKDIFPDFDTGAMDALMVDPVITELLQQLRTQYEPSALEADESRLLRDAYDRQWIALSLMNETATISGRVGYYVPATQDSPADVIERNVSDIRARSDGFTIIASVGQDGAIRRELAMSFFELVYDESGSVEKELPITIELDKLEYLRFDEVMSLKQAKAVLGFYAADVIKLLDKAMLDTDSELNAVEELRGVAIDLANTGNDFALVSRAMSVYTSELLQFDPNLPYIVPAGSTLFYTCDDNGENLDAAELELTTPTAMTVNRLVFMSPLLPDADTFGIVTPHLDCWIHNDYMHETSSRALVPVSGIKQIVSFRDTFRNSHSIHAS